MGRPEGVRDWVEHLGEQRGASGLDVGEKTRTKRRDSSTHPPIYINFNYGIPNDKRPQRPAVKSSC